jgi:hypothetical protein
MVGALERRCARAERVGEDVCRSFQVANGATKKENREGDGASDFDGSVEWLVDATTNRKSAVSLEYIWARQRAGQRQFGRTPSHLFGLRIKGQKINKTKFVMALEGRQSTIPHDNQPNKCGNNGGGLEEDGHPSGNAGGAAFDRSGAVELRGGKKYYKIEA